MTRGLQAHSKTPGRNTPSARRWSRRSFPPPEGVDALLHLPDAEIGRRFKERLWEVIGVATVLNLDLRAMHAEEQKLRGRIERESERYQLFLQGKLLKAEDLIGASGITEKALAKNINSGRVFAVELGSEPYYPVFFLSKVLDRKVLARVVRRLGDIDGWKKWEFFTTPIASLGGSTPLQLLRVNEVKNVMKAASVFSG